MKKLHIMVTKLLSFAIFISVLSSPVLAQRPICELYENRISSVHNQLKKIIQQEMLDVTGNPRNKEKLTAIWFQGGNRDKIRAIISTQHNFRPQDLRNLKQLIKEEKKLLPRKIERISSIVNADLHNQLAEKLKFNKSEEEIENIHEQTKVSPVQLTRQEIRTYNAILRKIDQINTINAYN